jgi:hypothetical protein
MENFWQYITRFLSFFEKLIAWFSVGLAIFILVLILLHEELPLILEKVPFMKELVEETDYLAFLIISLVFLFLVREILPTLEKLIFIISKQNAKIDKFEEVQAEDLKLNYKIYNKLNAEIPNLITLALGKSSIIQPSKHPEIWEGFVNTYFVLNAPWQLEKFMETAEYQDMVKLHAHRYKNKNLKKTYYIFYTKTPFKDSIVNFVNFQKEVLKLNPEAASKIEVILIDGVAPKYSLFLGEKILTFKEFSKQASSTSSTIPYLIIYFHEKPFIYKDGFPYWALISNQEDIFNVLKEYLLSLIHHARENAMEFNIEEFIKEFDKGTF